MSVLCWGRLMHVFFFKQKTAYEMRISDWSSDVCSSDLGEAPFVVEPHEQIGKAVAVGAGLAAVDDGRMRIVIEVDRCMRKIGRASCRKECVSTCRSRWSPYH